VQSVPVRLTAVTFDARDPARVAAFWAGALGRDSVEHAGGLLLPGSPGQLGLRFAASAAPKMRQNPVHLHLTSASADDQAATVARLLDLGGRHVDVGQLPDEEHVVLADPEGNELCVIEPGNTFLAGTGFLGELTCEGTREVGLFWAAALGWPLVWDSDEETAVQAPGGGTKVSWGGEPIADQRATDRQRLELAVDRDALADEVARLTTLGARELRRPENGQVELADPDGHVFVVRVEG